MKLNEKFYKELVDIVTSACVKTNELLNRYTTFRIGGPTDYLVTIESAKILSQVVTLCKYHEVPYEVIGKGSNLLVSDQGYRGAILKLQATTSKELEVLDKKDPQYQSLLANVELSDDVDLIRVGAGNSLISFGMEVAKSGYTGFEFATGVPGTVGGAVTMNAGAYGQEIKDTLLCATLVDTEGNIFTLSNEELKLGYRSSIVQDKKYMVVDAVFAFPRGEKEEIMALVTDLSKRRQEKQPLEYPSAGSTFKRPTGFFAGKLIQDAGLRGYQVGGAQVSEKHCGFVINKDGATAQDVCRLIQDVQRIVQEKFDVKLETEVKFLGEF